MVETKYYTQKMMRRWAMEKIVNYENKAIKKGNTLIQEKKKRRIYKKKPKKTRQIFFSSGKKTSR